MILKDFDKNLITSQLTRQFGFQINEIEKSLSGFNSKTFTIKTSSGKYFLKVVENIKFEEINRGLRLLEEIGANVTNKVNIPIRTKEDRFEISIDKYHKGILFTHLDGKWVFEGYERAKLADIIAQVHMYTPSNTEGVLTESFDHALMDKYKKTIATLEEVEEKDPFTNYYEECKEKYRRG